MNQRTEGGVGSSDSMMSFVSTHLHNESYPFRAHQEGIGNNSGSRFGDNNLNVQEEAQGNVFVVSSTRKNYVGTYHERHGVNSSMDDHHRRSRFQSTLPQEGNVVVHRSTHEPTRTQLQQQQQHYVLETASSRGTSTLPITFQEHTSAVRHGGHQNTLDPLPTSSPPYQQGDGHRWNAGDGGSSGPVNASHLYSGKEEDLFASTMKRFYEARLVKEQTEHNHQQLRPLTGSKSQRQGAGETGQHPHRTPVVSGRGNHAVSTTQNSRSQSAATHSSMLTASSTLSHNSSFVLGGSDVGPSTMLPGSNPNITFTCAACGGKRQAGLFCTACGYELPRPRECWGCGVLVRGKFCSKCGAPEHPPPHHNAEQYRSSVPSLHQLVTSGEQPNRSEHDHQRNEEINSVTTPAGRPPTNGTSILTPSPAGCSRQSSHYQHQAQQLRQQEEWVALGDAWRARSSAASTSMESVPTTAVDLRDGGGDDHQHLSAEGNETNHQRVYPVRRF